MNRINIFPLSWEKNPEETYGCAIQTHHAHGARRNGIGEVLQ
jgi:hypothetical protein